MVLHPLTTSLLPEVGAVASTTVVVVVPAALSLGAIRPFLEP